MDREGNDGNSARSTPHSAIGDLRTSIIPSFRRLVPLSPPAVNQTPSAYFAGALVQDDAIRYWAVHSHHLFSPESRQLVRLMLLIGIRLRREPEDSRRQRNRIGQCTKSRRIQQLPPLPVEIWQCILAMLRIDAVGLPVDTLAGTGSDGYTDGPSGEAQLGLLSGVCFDGRGGVLLADWGNHCIRRIAPSGQVTTVAGSGVRGYLDGPGQQAQFNNPTAVAVANDGAVIVADTDNHRIRRIDPDGAVHTLAGSEIAEGGDARGWFRDGPALEARFDHPAGVAIDRCTGCVIVADTDNHCIRRISKDGTMVLTLAGCGEQGYRDGPGRRARFRYLQGIAVDKTGNVLVSERFNHRIRQVAPDGTVTTLAGSGKEGCTDGHGTSASFNRPWGIAVDGNNNVLVADTNNHRIRRIATDGTVTTLKSFKRDHTDPEGDLFRFPRGISIDAQGGLVIGDFHRVCKCESLGVVLGPTYYVWVHTANNEI
eukprot:m.577772 g.577772  ORF g.577772 m.577772 type:complete len:483 (-) comp22300_c0_seq4:453-1901(-)